MTSCPYCGAFPDTAGMQYHLPWCSLNPYRPTIVYDDPTPLGWRCPVCGRGLAPDVRECSCSTVDEDGFDWEYRPPYVPPEA